MKEHIGVKNAIVTIYNKQGFKFTQDVGESGYIFRPRGFSGPVTLSILQELPGGKSNFFSMKLRQRVLLIPESKECTL